MSEALLEARDLTKEFLLDRKRRVHAVAGVTLAVNAGETLALVGESGCGKSTLGRMLIGALPPTSGSIRYKGDVITGLKARDFAPYRRQMQLIFQDPYASLDPRMKVRDLIAEPLVTHKVCSSKDEVTQRVVELMDAVKIPREHLNRYPHQFSGGQRQRIGIARAIALDPALIVCDEPVSALDVSVQNQILNLLGELQESRGLTYVFISHDLSVVRHISTRICVMFLGKIMEIGPTEEIFGEARHPYTQFLLDSVLPPDPHRRTRELKLLKGEPPSPVNPPTGCRFRTRCPFATELCAAQEPTLRQAGNTQVACHRDVKRGETPFDIMRSPTS
jgi:oligopeptide transport system ATP-binding protein